MGSVPGSNMGAGGGGPTGQEDWTKFVTLNPPNEVKFKIDEEAKKKEDGDVGIKATAKI